MDIIAVNENKLKVILSADDLKEFSLTAEDLDYSRAETRLLLKCLLIRAKNEVGFKSDGYRLLVQLYPSKQGGGEIYITKIGSLSDPDDYNFYDDPLDELFDHSRISCEAMEEEEKNTPDTLIRFDDVSAMIGYSKRLISSGYIGPSSAYFTEKHGKPIFYLYVCNNDECISLALSPSELASEYGQKISSEGKKRSILDDLSPIFSSVPSSSISALHILSGL